MMRELLPFTIALFAAGCSLTPDYQRPVAPVPAVWPADANQTVGGGATATAIDWRSVFTDPQLRGLIAGALEHNRDLRIAVGRVDEARALAGIASADRFPGIDLGAQRAASLTPGDLSATGRQLNAQRYDANLGVTAFELDFWGRVKSLDDAARASFLATDYARRAFRLSLIADVAGAWLSWLELDERAGLAADTAKSRGETRRLIDKRREVGLAGDLDFLAADGAWQSARADAASLARQRAVAANALRLLVGKEVELRGASLATLAPIADLPAGLPAEVLLARPDVLAAEQKLIATNANIGAARAAFLPKILLTAVAGTASRALSGLFDAGRSEGNLDLALARRNVAVADYEKTLQQAFREVADLLAARQYYAEQMTALGAAARAQGERMQRVEARYLAGVSGQLELLDAQREHQAAQQSALAARRSWLASAASLYKALSAGEE
jgi:multidrug efflux system outer membrane protein